MSKKTRVAIMFGGVSTEHEVSVVSAASIFKSMDRKRFEPVCVAIDKQGRFFLGEGAFDLLRGRPAEALRHVMLSSDPDKKGFVDLDNGEVISVDVLFPVLHGPRGEDGTIQGLFELTGLPYVGCDVGASAIAIDKDLTKRILSQRGIPVVKGTCVSAFMWQASRDEVLGEIETTLKHPLFVKPATMGSSVGISKAASREALIAGIDEALKYSSKVVVEEAVDAAMEIEVAVLGHLQPQASVPGQVVPCNEYYDYAAKYVDNDSKLIIPAPLDRVSSDNLQFLALEAFEAIGGSGLARVDFLVAGETCYLNEINTLPGFTSISMYPKLWESSGISYPELITVLIDLAIARQKSCSQLIKTIELERELEV